MQAARGLFFLLKETGGHEFVRDMVEEDTVPCCCVNGAFGVQEYQTNIEPKLNEDQ